MTNHSNNNAQERLANNNTKSQSSSHSHIQDQLVKDSIAHKQHISTQAQMRQSPLPSAADFTQVAD